MENLRRIRDAGQPRDATPDQKRAGAQAQGLLDQMEEIEERQRQLRDRRTELDRELTRVNPRIKERLAQATRLPRTDYKGGDSSKKPESKVTTTTGDDPKVATEPKPARVAPSVTPPRPKETPIPAKGTPVRGANKNVAKAIADINSGAAKAWKFAGRLKGYGGAIGALFSVLDMLATIDSMAKLLAHGTVLVEEQREADQVVTNSHEALRGAEAVDEDIHFAAWTIVINEAARNGDDQALLKLDDALTELHRSLDASATQLKDMADELDRRATALKKESINQRDQILQSTDVYGTASRALAFAFHVSLDKLHASVSNSADNYAAASEKLAFWADGVKGFADATNSATWDVAQKRAAERLRQERAAEQHSSGARGR
jgi:hypothetical protein